MYHCPKKNWTLIKFCFSINKISKNIKHLFLTKNSRGITFHHNWDHTKAKDSEIVATPLYLENISKDFFLNPSNCECECDKSCNVA